MTSRALRHPLTIPAPSVVLVALAAFAWLAAVAQTAWWPGVSHWPLRVAVLMLGVGLAVVLLRGPRPVLALSPLTAFGILCPLFYCILPARLAAEADTTLVGILPAFSHDALRSYVSGRAELLVLQFAAMCIAVGAGIARLCEGNAASAPVPALRRGGAARGAAALAGAIIGVLSLVLMMRFRLDGVAAWMSQGLGRQVLDGFAPLIAASIALMSFLAVGRSRGWHFAAIVFGLVGAGALLTTGAAKSAVYAVVGALLLYVAAARLRGRTLIGMMLLALGAFATSVVLLAELRHGQVSYFAARGPAELTRFVERALVSKTVGRQAETGACLHRVIATHLGAPPARSPFYFLEAIVPRLLWPDKPNLSLGSRYAFDYCGYRPENMDAGHQHSLSITLVGQPIVNAGLAGLAVAQIVLLCGLAAATLLAVRAGAAGAVALAALMPWLADFDQSFSLYLANGLKMLLYMSPVLVALAAMERKGRNPAAGATR